MLHLRPQLPVLCCLQCFWTKTRLRGGSDLNNADLMQVCLHLCAQISWNGIQVYHHFPPRSHIGWVFSTPCKSYGYGSQMTSPFPREAVIHKSCSLGKLAEPASLRDAGPLKAIEGSQGCLSPSIAAPGWELVGPAQIRVDVGCVCCTHLVQGLADLHAMTIFHNNKTSIDLCMFGLALELWDSSWITSRDPSLDHIISLFTLLPKSCWLQCVVAAVWPLCQQPFQCHSYPWSWWLNPNTLQLCGKFQSLAPGFSSHCGHVAIWLNICRTILRPVSRFWQRW